MLNIKLPATDIIGCRFPECTGRNGEVAVNGRSKEYFYKLLPGQPKPKIGDLVVTSCTNGFQVCTVTTLNALCDFKDLAYVVGVVDVDAYKAELARQYNKKQLYTELMRKKKELEDSVTLDLLAERSPEFKELLETYRNL